MRVVLDTNVLVRAGYRIAGPAHAVLQVLEAPPHTLIASAYLLAELQRVLHYPRLFALHGLDAKGIRQFVERVALSAELVNLGSASIAVSPDPADNPILQTAMLGKADKLCTLDHHFRHADVQAFGTAHGLEILSDIELLQLLRSLQSGSP